MWRCTGRERQERLLNIASVSDSWVFLTATDTHMCILVTSFTNETPQLSYKGIIHWIHTEVNMAKYLSCHLHVGEFFSPAFPWNGMVYLNSMKSALKG